MAYPDFKPPRAPQPTAPYDPRQLEETRKATLPTGSQGTVTRGQLGSPALPTTFGPVNSQGIVKAASEQATWGQYGPEGLSQMVPGYEEQQFRDTRDLYNNPLAFERWVQEQAPGMTAPQQGGSWVYNALGQGPELPSADLSAYFENAKRRAAENINAEMAARGSWGSSAATDRISEAMTDLEAQRAMEEAGYGLKRADLARGWTETLGGLGLRADEERLAQMLGAGKLMEAGGGTTLERMGAGRQAAAGAQEAQRARAQDYLNAQFREAEAMGGVAGQAYEDLITGDVSLLEAELQARMGMSSEALQAAYRKQVEERQTTGDYMSWLANMYKTGKELKSEGED